MQRRRAALAPRGRFQRGLRLATRSVALVVALGLLAVSAAVHQQARAISAFYDTPSTVPTTPGALLRSESYTTAVPRDAQAWLILYSTKGSLGKPAVGSAIVLAARDLPSGPRPVILRTHGTVGIARPCAPSVSADPLSGVPAVPGLLHKGWVMVASTMSGWAPKISPRT